MNSVLANLLEQNYRSLFEHLSLRATSAVQKIDGYYSVIAQLTEMDSIESAYLISSLYAQLIRQEDRSRNGVYFTPPSVSRRVIQEVSRIKEVSLINSRIIDPCSGGGAFLAPLAAFLRDELKVAQIQPEERLQRISKNICGVDICKTLVDLSKIFCLIELNSDIARAGRAPQINIDTKDFLSRGIHGENFDVIIGNPPFRRLASSEREKYLVTYGESHNGGSNLYGMFIHKSLSLARPGGVVCLIIPSSLFAGVRFEYLRSLIRDRADVTSIEIMQEREGVFMDVQQETAILTLRKLPAGAQRKNSAKITSISKAFSPMKIGACVIPLGKSPWIIPRKREQLAASRLFSSDLPKISDYGLSIRTGSVVWNRDKRPRFSTVDEELSSNQIRYPLIWSECIGKDGSFDFSRAERRAPDGLFVGTHDTDPELLKISAVAIKRTSNSGQDRRIYCAHIHSQFVFKYGAYLAENHVNLLFQSNGQCSIDLELFARILNSTPVDDAFRCLSGSSAVSKYELTRLPIPDIELVQKRIDQGMNIDEAIEAEFYDI